MDNQKQRSVTPKNTWKVLIWLGLLAFFIYSYYSIIDLEDLSNPWRHNAFVRILVALSQPNLSDGEIITEVITKMWETIQIAFLATSISAVLAIPFTFLISKTSTTWGSVINIILQPILSVIRAVHPLIVATFSVVLVGIGPTAGVLALTMFSTAVLMGKFTEYMQERNILSWSSLITIYFPVIAFRYFPTNALNASILGFWGGGGIGFFIRQNFSLLAYHDASVALLAMIISIGSLDLLSQIVWKKVHKVNENIFS